MKKLYVVRHAKSSWDDPWQDDFDRPLNKRGKQDAPRMGKRLKEREIHPELCLASPAERALSTAKIIAEKMGYNVNDILTDQKLYHATEGQILSVVKTLNDGNVEVMLFAHNPGLTDFVNNANAEPLTDNIPTCGVVALMFAVDSWQEVAWGKGVVKFFDYPKKGLKG